MLTRSQIKDIFTGEIDPRILAARSMADKLRLHVDGVGMQEYLARINNYENEGQFEARKKHAISNKAIVEDLLRNTDNVFSARGGSKTYEFKTDKSTDKFIELLSNVKSGLSLSQYIEQSWFHNFVTDPNGLTFVEVSPEEEEGDRTAKPTYKSIYSIRAYEQDGINVDWVIFEPHKICDDNDNESFEFWYVDKIGYYLYEIKSDEIKELKFIENSFGKVPAVLCSNLIDPVTGWKKSPIDAQVELLNKHLVSNSVLSIAEFFHNYPQQWMYVSECGKCNGTGEVSKQNRSEIYVNVECSSCKGTGKRTKKDVTDITELKIPRDNEQKIAPDISGYIFMPTDAWKLMTDSVDRSSQLIYFSHWGTTQEKGKNETATGRFIDVQPVNNRLDGYSSSGELIHTSLANLFGIFYFPETFTRAFIQYGRRYLIETPDQIWDKYLKAKEAKAPISTLDLLLSQFLESEFRENEMAFTYEIKKVKLEPFVHWDIVTVKGLGVSDVDYKKKLYFSDWIQTKTIKEIIEGDIKKLNENLTLFVNTKNINIKTEE